jgi:ligand-binding sensor domain-containing protein
MPAGSSAQLCEEHIQVTTVDAGHRLSCLMADAHGHWWIATTGACSSEEDLQVTCLLVQSHRLSCQTMNVHGHSALPL